MSTHEFFLLRCIFLLHVEAWTRMNHGMGITNSSSIARPLLWENLQVPSSEVLLKEPGSASALIWPWRIRWFLHHTLGGKNIQTSPIGLTWFAWFGIMNFRYGKPLDQPNRPNSKPNFEATKPNVTYPNQFSRIANWHANQFNSVQTICKPMPNHTPNLKPLSFRQCLYSAMRGITVYCLAADLSHLTTSG